MISDFEIKCINEFYGAKDEKTARKARGKFWRYQRLKRKLHLDATRSQEGLYLFSHR